MSKQSLIAAMKGRLTYHVGRQLLADAGFPKGRTWDDIVDKLSEAQVNNAASEPKLRENFAEALAVCDKLTTLYPVSQPELAAAHKAAAKIAGNLPASPLCCELSPPVG